MTPMCNIHQGASASDMTAAKVLDTNSRLPGTSSEANDAVSAYTQVKMSGASILLKLPERITQQFGSSSLEAVVRSIGRTSLTQRSQQNGHSLAGLHWERRLEQVLLQGGWEKVQPGMSLLSQTDPTIPVSIRRRGRKWLDEEPSFAPMWFKIEAKDCPRGSHAADPSS